MLQISENIHYEPQRDSYCNVGSGMLWGIPSVLSDHVRHPSDSFSLKPVTTKMGKQINGIVCGDINS